MLASIKDVSRNCPFLMTNFHPTIQYIVSIHLRRESRNTIVEWPSRAFCCSDPLSSASITFSILLRAAIGFFYNTNLELLIRAKVS